MPSIQPPRGRSARALIVAAEAIVAAVVGGLAVGGVLGWTIAGVAVALALLMAILSRLSGQAVAGSRGVDDPAGTVRVLGVPSRSSGEVGVISDGQGYAAGVEFDIAKGVLLDLAPLAAFVAADPSRPSSVQVRLTTYAPPAPGSGTFRRAQGAALAVHRRLHVLLRLEPAWASDVVARHGGGAQGSRAALVAALDRLAAWLRRDGIAGRVLDAAALNVLLAEDTGTHLVTRQLVADFGSRADLQRVIDLVQQAGPERSIVSVSVVLAGSDQWQSHGAVAVGARTADELGAVAALLLADAAIGTAPSSTGASVLPLGGGSGDLTAVLTLART
jgi:hypothetical protein